MKFKLRTPVIVYQDDEPGTMIEVDGGNGHPLVACGMYRVISDTQAAAAIKYVESLLNAKAAA